MHTYTAEIRWEDTESAFATGKYPRAHDWVYDGIAGRGIAYMPEPALEYRYNRKVFRF